MGKGILEITPELLASVLLLPAGMRITSIRKNDKVNLAAPDTYSVTVKDMIISKTKGGKAFPRVVLNYETIYDEKTDKSEVILSGWTTLRDRDRKQVK